VSPPSSSLARRVVRTLRAGTASEESVRVLSVGTEQLVVRLVDHLTRDVPPHERTLLVPGDWGFGKSHMRMLCTALLAEQGLPFVRDAIDGKACSLAHLHRCVPRWLETLRWRQASGLRHLVRAGAIDHGRAVAWCSRQSDPHACALRVALSGSQSTWLTALGHQLRTPDYSYQHPRAAGLLSAVAGLLHAAGPGRLVLLLDEVENIDRQPDVRGRRKSYATLGRFGQDPALRTVLFITPRFVQQAHADLCRGTGEGWYAWPEHARQFLEDLPRFLTLAPPHLDDALAQDLVRQLVAVYEQAAGPAEHPVSTHALLRLWHQTTTRSVRLLVRLTIGYLDCQQLRSNRVLRDGN
jgi:hypothetical protein